MDYSRSRLQLNPQPNFQHRLVAAEARLPVGTTAHLWNQLQVPVNSRHKQTAPCSIDRNDHSLPMTYLRRYFERCLPSHVTFNRRSRSALSKKSCWWPRSIFVAHSHKMRPKKHRPADMCLAECAQPGALLNLRLPMSRIWRFLANRE